MAKTAIVEHELIDKKNVLMYEPENSSDLAAKILKLHNDNALRQNIGLKLFEYVQNCNWNAIGKNLIETF